MLPRATSGGLLCLLWACVEGLYRAPLGDEVALVQVHVGSSSGLLWPLRGAGAAEPDDGWLAAAMPQRVDSRRLEAVDGAAAPAAGDHSGDGDEPASLWSHALGVSAALLEVGSALSDKPFADRGLPPGESGTVGELGFHAKLVEALPKLQQECKLKRAISDCDRAETILSLLINSTVGPEPKPPYTHHSLANGMAGLSFFMYFPGPMYAFATLDTNHDNVVQMSEIWKNIPIEVGDGTLMVENGLFEILDGVVKDGNVTRTDLYEYMRSLILVRDVLPSLDLVNPIAPTPKCLISARRVLQGAKLPPKKLGYYTKVLCIFFIFTGALASHFFLCATPPKEMDVR